jgi:hypothetical protein
VTAPFIQILIIIIREADFLRKIQTHFMFIFSCRLQQRGDPPHLFMNNATITRRRKKLSLHQTPKLVSTSHKGGGGGGEGEARKRKKKRIIIMVKKSLWLVLTEMEIIIVIIINPEVKKKLVVSLKKCVLLVVIQ